MTKKTAELELPTPAQLAEGGDSADQPVPRRANGRRKLGKQNEVVSLALLKQSTIRLYQDIYKEIYRNGALDRRTKELIAIAASAMIGCEGCLNGHLRKARALGVKNDEIKEAVAVAFSVSAAAVVDRTDIAAATLQFIDKGE